jgi:hypothetical protein
VVTIQAAQIRHNAGLVSNPPQKCMLHKSYMSVKGSLILWQARGRNGRDVLSLPLEAAIHFAGFRSESARTILAEFLPGEMLETELSIISSQLLPSATRLGTGGNCPFGQWRLWGDG